MARQTLTQAIMLARTGKSRDLARAATVLSGKPEGGWAETRQARRELIDALPLRTQRLYSAGEFIGAAYRLEDVDPRAARIYRSALE